VQRILSDTSKDVPRGSYVALRGQVETMTSAYSQLYFGLIAAIVLIYLVMVVNFQSWLDPFIIITALPGALAGIVWMLFTTDTTLSVPALTGALMCMGIATANSVLLVSFAREKLREGYDATAAALDAGFTRFRPVLMTALAMIIGMLPMAFALGEGGEQNAPLGRAVIGGLLVATFATLFFVPTVFSLLHSRRGYAPRGWIGFRCGGIRPLSWSRAMSEHHDQRSEEVSALPGSRRTLRFLGVAAAAVAIVVAAGGILSRNRRREGGREMDAGGSDSDRLHPASQARHGGPRTRSAR